MLIGFSDSNNPTNNLLCVSLEELVNGFIIFVAVSGKNAPLCSGQ